MADALVQVKYFLAKMVLGKMKGEINGGLVEWATELII